MEIGNSSLDKRKNFTGINGLLILVILLLSFGLNGQNPDCDLILRNGTIIDGSGKPAFRGDIAISYDSIVAIGDLKKMTASQEVDLTGLLVSPGFINMLSWADAALIKDGRSMSDIKQGVTLEVFGEGWSPGPKKFNPKARWNTLGEFLTYAEKKGVSPNIASFVGATTIRMYVLGTENRAPTADELFQMKSLVKKSMEEGAMGLGSSLIYAPADFAGTDELIELAKVASSYGGMYITHLRSESDNILSAMNEAFSIAQKAQIPTEIYHLKINHQRNWNKIDQVLYKIDSARKAGLKITADMYPYIASSTGLNARIPTWAQEGGMAATRKRLKDPVIRQRVLDEMEKGIPTKNSDPGDVVILSFRKDSLNKLYKGKRLDAIAKLHGKSPDETVLDLIIADRSAYPIPALYFLMSEDNMLKMLQLPFVSICSDGSSIANDPENTMAETHPRVYGSFSRFLGKYVRDQKLMSIEEGVRRMTSLPAENLKIEKRGLIQKGYFADLAIFDLNQLKDAATFENSHVYAEGMIHVLVNGQFVLENGEHTGKKPGRAIRGPGFQKKDPAGSTQVISSGKK